MEKKSDCYIYIFSVFLFFCVSLLLTVDSVQYYSYIDFFRGIKPVSSWLPIRGWAMPFILYIGYLVSPSSGGALVVFGLIYLFFIVLCNKYFKFFVAENLIYCKYALLLVLFILNPIIYSYSHIVLVEFPSAVTATVLLLMVADRYKNCGNSTVDLKKIISYIVISSLCTILLYFFKANYVFMALVLIASSEILIIITNRGKAYYSIVVFVSNVLLLIVSLGIFSCLVDKNNKYDASVMIMGGMRYFEIDGPDAIGTSIIFASPIGERNVFVKDSEGKTIDSFSYKFERSKKSYIRFVLKCLKNNPKRVFWGYLDNFLLICGVYGRPYDRTKGNPLYQIGYAKKGNVINNLYNRNEDFFINQELVGFTKNLRIGVDLDNQLSRMKNMNLPWWNEYVEKFRGERGGCVGRLLANQYSINLFISIYALGVLFSPVLCIVFFVLFVKKKSPFFTGVLFVLNLVVFSQAMILTLTGSVVDRYMFPSFVYILFEVGVSLASCFERLPRSIKCRQFFDGFMKPFSLLSR